ncbi:MAG: hypothetical protein MUF38_11140 [Anaerolineae bacterium]|jgi:hypothetical protein|nr:hypothetical protein [Anaerolineae bacterium]
MMRKMMVAMLMAAMLLVSGVSMAQTEVACGGLSEADCAILTQSAEAMAGVTSATFVMDFVIDTGDQGAMTIAADGSYNTAELAAFDAEALASLNSADPTVALTVLKDVIAAFDGTLNLTISGSPEIGLPADVNVSLVLVDGIGYMNFAQLAALAGADGDQMLTAFGITEWAGLELVGAIDMLGGMAGDMGDMGAATPDVEASEAAAEAALNYITVARGADVDGEAVFTTTIDLAGLINDPAFADIMAAQGGEMSEADMTEALAVLEGVVIIANSTIDLETLFQTSVSFEFAISGEALAAAGGDAPSNLSLTGSIQFDNFNNAPAITAPEGPVATIMDLMGLMGGMGGF